MKFNLIDPERFKEYERHPLSAIWGDLPPDELKTLAEDIEKNGLVQDLFLYDGKIIDGWNRYRACRMVKFPPFYRHLKVKPEELVGWVIAQNGHRRHLTPEQRALAVARSVDFLKHGGDRKTPEKIKTSPDVLINPESQKPVVTIATAAKMAKVSPKTMERAKAKVEAEKTAPVVKTAPKPEAPKPQPDKAEARQAVAKKILAAIQYGTTHGLTKAETLKVIHRTLEGTPK